MKVGNLEKDILEVCRYFSFFNYPPTFLEIYTFLPKKCSKKKLKEELDRLVEEKKIFVFDDRFFSPFKNTMGGQGIRLKIKNQIKKQILKFRKRYLASKEKLKNLRFKFYLKLLSFFPQIKLVGLSGSMAMMNAKKNDDIDLFVITAKNRLFTGRFIAVFLAKLFWLYRPRFSLDYKNKVCLNLFFDEENLEVPDFKKTKYVAHEILQMKPLIVKDDIYQQFLRANRWVYKIFPNARLLNSKFKGQSSKLRFKIKNYFKNFRFLFLIFHFLGDKIEKILKIFQLYLINRHRTTEIILKNQLWFHPKDFNKLKSLRRFY